MKIYKQLAILGQIILICLSICQLDVLPAAAAGASLFLTPSSGSYAIGKSFNVSVKVNSGGAVVNAAEGAISYDTKLLDVTGVSKSGSIFPFWTTEPAAAGGTVRFGGGLPPPAYNGSGGQIITISFKAKAAGTARVAFTSGAVLANDGKGTNIISGMGSASYTISAQVTPPSKETPSEPAKPAESEYNKPVIKSSTHPDQNKWYNLNTVKFSWDLPGSVNGVSVSFDENPVADPGPVSDGLFSEKEFPDMADGVWYLHVKFKDSRWGTIAHYRVMIDTKPPEPFEIEVRQIDIGEWPELNFKTTDKGSGLDKYEVFLGSLDKQAHELEPDTDKFQVTDLEVGKHTAMIRATDKAGNERLAAVEFEITAIPAPAITYWSQEIKARDRFVMNGTAAADAGINIYIEKDNRVIATSSTASDAAGQWFYMSAGSFENGRYVVWAEAVNKNGIKSLPSEKKSFLVSPPVFAVIGDWVINYFTVLASLLFMVVLIILMIFWIIWLVRKKLKKETGEVETILHKNAEIMKRTIEEEFALLSRYEGKAGYKREKEKAREALIGKVDENEKKTLKEIKDVEEILK